MTFSSKQTKTREISEFEQHHDQQNSEEVVVVAKSLDMLKVQPPQVLRSGSSCMDRPIGFSALAPAHLLCSNSACILQE